MWNKTYCGGKRIMYCGTNVWVWEFAFKFWKWLGVPIGIFILLNPGILETIFFWSTFIYTPEYLGLRTYLVSGSCITLSLIMWGIVIHGKIKQYRANKSTN